LGFPLYPNNLLIEKNEPNGGTEANKSFKQFIRFVKKKMFWCVPFGYLYFSIFFNVIAAKTLTSIQYVGAGVQTHNLLVMCRQGIGYVSFCFYQLNI
jgi:hypothetical protein